MQEQSYDGNNPYPRGSLEHQRERYALEGMFTSLWEQTQGRIERDLYMRGVRDYEDLTQVIALWAWEHIHQFEGHTPGQMFWWLRWSWRIALRDLRRQNKMFTSPDLESDPLGHPWGRVLHFPDSSWSTQDEFEAKLVLIHGLVSNDSLDPLNLDTEKTLDRLSELVGMHELSVQGALKLASLAVLADRLWMMPRGTATERMYRKEIAKLWMLDPHEDDQIKERACSWGLPLETYRRRNLDLLAAINHLCS